MHLIGAAISNRAPSKNTQFGTAIDTLVDNFYNLYNPKDNLLQGLYVKTENENPLGLFGLNKGEPFPQHYTEHNVMSEIPPFKNASGIINHLLIIQYPDGEITILDILDSENVIRLINLLNYGAINVIVADWRNTNK
jgi:hypothetical protein